MPKYLYRCRECGELTLEHRSLDARNDAAECPNCQLMTAEREFSANFQVIAHREVDKAENRHALCRSAGLSTYSAKDELEIQKADDKAYEEKWANAPPLPKKRTNKEIFDSAPKMREIFEQVKV